MREGKLDLLRLSVLALVIVSAGAILVFRGTAAGPVHRLEAPVLRAAPTPIEAPRTKEAGEVVRKRGEASRIGSFEEPESVPEYEILEKRADERNGAHAARLLVDTRSRSQRDFTLIARDLKARYAHYDAVTVEFTDAADVLGYNGSALIFNTYDGVTYMGYIYGPPNMDGYYVVEAAP